MTARDWQMLTAPELGDPLADIMEWMLPSYSDADVQKWGDSDEKQKEMERRGLCEKLTI